MALLGIDPGVFDWIVEAERTMGATGRDLLAHWHRHWGATADEITTTLPGDVLLPRAQFRSTRAITIDPPSDGSRAGT
jgi:hypothetical protein